MPPWPGQAVEMFSVSQHSVSVVEVQTFWLEKLFLTNKYIMLIKLIILSEDVYNNASTSMAQLFF